MCASSARRQLEASSSGLAIVSRVAGRTSRTRSCTPPSSNMREGAGSRTAARLERALTASLGLVVGAGLPCADIERGIGGQRHQPVAAANLHEIGGGPGAGMLIERFAADDR